MCLNGAQASGYAQTSEGAADMRGASTADIRRATAPRVRGAGHETAGMRPAVRSVGIIAVGPNATAALQKATAATMRMALPAPAARMDTCKRCHNYYT